MPRVNIVIPNWNGIIHLPECMRALSDQNFRDFETIVVDNASSDESVAWLRSEWPDVQVICRADNGGFSVAVNEGIRASDAEMVALLNNDTLADPDWLGELVAALDAHPSYDTAASLMLFYDGDGTVNAAGDVFGFTTLSAHNRGFRCHESGYTEPQRVLGACAGAALYRRSLFDDIGLFDESFFLMHEDTDLNIRALIMGKKALYVPSSRILHKHSASVRTMPSKESGMLRARNEGIVVGMDMPIELLLLAPFTRAWTLARQTILMEPKHWANARKRLRRARREARAWNEGFRIGLKRRGELWPRRRASHIEILRWLLKGSGPVR